MGYPIEKAFQTIDSQGVERIVTMIKLALKEMPRLQAAFIDLKRQKEVKPEIRFILSAIGTEMDNLAATRTDSESVRNAIYNPQNFTPEEWASLQHFLQLLQKLAPLIFKDDPKLKKPKWIYPKA